MTRTRQHDVVRLGTLSDVFKKMFNMHFLGYKDQKEFRVRPLIAN